MKNRKSYILWCFLLLKLYNLTFSISNTPNKNLTMLVNVERILLYLNQEKLKKLIAYFCRVCDILSAAIHSDLFFRPSSAVSTFRFSISCICLTSLTVSIYFTRCALRQQMYFQWCSGLELRKYKTDYKLTAY